VSSEAPPTWEQFDALYARIGRAEAALVVAREREQRLRGALQQIANHNVRAPVTGTSADDPCDWHCTAQQRDLARAALVDEPAAATLAEPEGSVEEAHHGATVEARVATPPGSASAAADEPQLPPCDCRANDWVEGDNGAIRCEQCGGYAGEPGTSIRVVPAAADEPGETPA
jgi:hypothetical protein